MIEDDLRRNTLLARLPADELARLSPRLRVAPVPIRFEVYSPREPIRSVWFPLGAIFSLVAATDDRRPVEVGTIGYEGMVGLPLFLGSATSPHFAFCQVAGDAAELAAADLGEFLATDGALHRLLHRFTQATMVQLAQSVFCNNAHTVEQRAARWLLMTADRTRSESFSLTQDFLAQMLGVQRTTVTEVAGRLQAHGLIRYARGQIEVTGRAGLEATACECYVILRDEFARSPEDPLAR